MDPISPPLGIEDLRQILFQGLVIPAMPLALRKDRSFDPLRQQALLRYYIHAGAGGIAVGVHTTQFEIRQDHDLFREVLRTSAQAVDACLRERGSPPFVKIAGICGTTDAALEEAELALSSGYDAGLLSLAALRDSTVGDIVQHCREVSRLIPLVGFYLQPAVGGRVLPFRFWKEFVNIENVAAIKVAPFNRYKTLDVLRAVCEEGKEQSIAVYTGNDDHILIDLLTGFTFETSRGTKRLFIRGGLLGHWSVWTKKAVQLLERVKRIRQRMEEGEEAVIPSDLLSTGAKITDANSAFFDAANDFKGCIPGLHEVLRRQGLFAGTWCLNPEEKLSEGQSAEIDRVYRAYPELNDDDFVRAHLAEWLQR